MNTRADGLAKWHRFVSEKDEQALAEALADDVLFHSPVLWKPKEGKATALLLFQGGKDTLRRHR